MSVIVESVDKALAHVFVDHGVVCDIELPCAQFCCRGQLPVNQKVRDFEKGGVLGELFDGVAAIPQDSGVTVKISD